MSPRFLPLTTGQAQVLRNFGPVFSRPWAVHAQAACAHWQDGEFIMNEVTQQSAPAARCVLLGGTGRSPVSCEIVGIAPRFADTGKRSTPQAAPQPSHVNKGRSLQVSALLGMPASQFGWSRPYLTCFGRTQAEPLRHGVRMGMLEPKPIHGQPDLLTDESSVADCVRCSSERAVYRLWQSQENGCIREHWSIHCPDCGFADEDTKPSEARP